MNEINVKLLDNSNVYKVGFSDDQDVRALVEWDDIKNKPENYPPSPHTHEASDVHIDNSDLEIVQSDNAQAAVEEIDTALSDMKTNKADISDIPHNLSDLNEDSSHRTVSDMEKSVWNAKSDFSGNFNDLTGKPETYPPSEHTHTGEQVGVITTEMVYLDGSDVQEVFKNIDYDIVDLYEQSAKKQDKKDKVNNIDMYLALEDYVAQEYYPSIIGVRDYVAKQKQGLYVVPEGGIPKNDMAESVQASLDKADRSIQSLKGYATESYVNSSIATNTAYFRGKYDSIEQLRSYLGPKTLNDYAFVVIYESGSTTQVKQYDRYKWNGVSWVFEYTLNNSSFTDAQWKSINSGIDVFDVEKFRDYQYTKADKSEVPTSLSELISDPNHRLVTDDEKNLWNASSVGYIKPETGIPKSDLSQDVVDSLNKADASVETVLVKPKSSNLYDETTRQYGYISVDGVYHSDNTFLCSDYIPVETGKTYTLQIKDQSSTFQIRFLAAYDSEKNIVPSAGGEKLNYYTVPTGVSYIRFSDYSSRADRKLAFVNSDVAIPYEEYNPVEITKDVLNTDMMRVFNIPYGKKMLFDMSSDDHSLSKVYDNKNDYVVSFFGKITTFNEIQVGVGISETTSNGYVDINNTDLKLYKKNGLLIKTENHGLTIKDYISVEINSNGLISVKTNGGTFTTTDDDYYACNGDVEVKSVGTNVLTDCILSYYCQGVCYDNWLYGDSYVSIKDITRWACLLYNEHPQVLVNGYSGRTTEEALVALKNCLELASPKRLIWTLGMNDGSDTETAPNMMWQSGFDIVKRLSEQYGFELVLGTIPNVPTVDNSKKNEAIRNSGYRYIDFAKAISPNDSNTWFDGMLHSDNKHPTEEGAKALYTRAITDCPELMSGSNIPDIEGKESKSNKVTTLDANSTDTQYPSAKCVYDIVGNIEAALAQIRGEV